MGFSSDMITEVLKKTKTTEAAIEWILEESTCIMSGSAEALGTLQMCAPSTSEGHPSTFVGLGAAEPDDASSRRSSKASALSGCQACLRQSPKLRDQADVQVSVPPEQFRSRHTCCWHTWWSSVSRWCRQQNGGE